MALFLGEISHANHEVQGCLEIRKRKLSFDMMAIHNIPLRHLFLKRADLFRRQGRHTAAAWHTGKLRKF
jgi:hypothetical protein